ncbi:uncharacterized protein LOC132644456 [Lycium barbarum]|uniref:uncharacterized protein LOC132644456 n=1 Tax=Lycium barbarum TaxID=112863 RepID=UPI00293F6775|nr:uncharacterized protein LOC132644456 [Lycium barbarum]
MEALHHFSAVTGLSANSDKSSIYMAGVDDETKTKLLESTCFRAGSFPMKYLGLPLSPKKWTKLDCHQLSMKVTEKIRSVASRHLSYAGKLQVVNSILFSLHNFWGAVFILPQIVLKDVDEKCQDYLWGSSENAKKVSLVAWEKVCKPKKHGGLNIRSCRKWNMASVGKLVWLLVTDNEALWVKWVHGIYMKSDVDFWSHTPPSDCSWYWKNLNKIKLGMQQWFSQRRYMLTKDGNYSVTMSYLTLLANTDEMEDHTHLFVDCAWSKAVWRDIEQWLGVQVPQVEANMMLQFIHKKRWCRMKKEIIAAAHGARIYFI